MSSYACAAGQASHNPKQLRTVNGRGEPQAAALKAEQSRVVAVRDPANLIERPQRSLKLTQGRSKKRTHREPNRVLLSRGKNAESIDRLLLIQALARANRTTTIATVNVRIRTSWVRSDEHKRVNSCERQDRTPAISTFWSLLPVLPPGRRAGAVQGPTLGVAQIPATPWNGGPHIATSLGKL
jgi:hypothetical protein